MFKAIFTRIIDLIRNPQATWVRIGEENLKSREIQNRFFYPLMAIVTVGTIVGIYWGKNFALDALFKDTIVVLTSTFAGYFMSVIILNEIISSRLFNMKKQHTACVRLVAYSSSILLCITAIIAIFPDWFILWVAYFYTAYIIWEGAGIIFSGLEENKKGTFTAICFILIFASPFLVKTLMEKMMK